jgi:hypothetical protein
MVVMGRGMNDRRVPTAPAAREPQNRRVEIVFPEEPVLPNSGTSREVPTFFDAVFRRINRPAWSDRDGGGERFALRSPP